MARNISRYCETKNIYHYTYDYGKQLLYVYCPIQLVCSHFLLKDVNFAFITLDSSHILGLKKHHNTKYM